MIDKKDKILSQDEKQILTFEECDLTIGYLEDCLEIIYHGAVEAQEEKGHYIVLCEYDGGGKDVEWVVDTPKIEAKPAWEEHISYRRYCLYREEELKIKENKNQIEQCKQQLADSDFKLFKFLEGIYTEDEYRPFKEKREVYSQVIRDLEAENEKLEKKLEQERNK
jgi:hypothetical protein